MNIYEHFRMALSSVLANKLRSGLTMLGIIIGISSVILIVAIGYAGEQMIKSQIVGSGNTIDIYYIPSEKESMTKPDLLNHSIFTKEDIFELSKINGVKNVVASSSEQKNLRFKDQEVISTITSINNSYVNVNSLDVEKGRTLNKEDFLSGSRVGLISHDLYNEIFNQANGIGKVVWVQEQPIEIIGVLKKKTGILSIQNKEIFIPDISYYSIFGKIDYTQISLQAHQPEQLKTIGEEASTLLNHLHDKKDSYQVNNLEEIAQSLGKITEIMTKIISSIAGVSLLVGGIGVMNIMLVSVTERTREIGIRKSLGATKSNILIQFLIESITITIIGGILGILLGLGGASLLFVFAGWPLFISWKAVIMGMSFSLAIGIIFGLLPANKAAKMDPVDAIRYE